MPASTNSMPAWTRAKHGSTSASTNNFAVDQIDARFDQLDARMDACEARLDVSFKKIATEVDQTVDALVAQHEHDSAFDRLLYTMQLGFHGRALPRSRRPHGRHGSPA